jgi:hypothetical protein
MHRASAAVRNDFDPDYAVALSFRPARDTMRCDWLSLRTQLLTQWGLLNGRELDGAGRSRHEIALLVQRKYGVSAPLVENYLSNLERTLPAFSL